MLFWTATLVVPVIVLLLWWFRAVQPQDYFSALYSADLPFVTRIPLIALTLGALLAMFAKNRVGPCDQKALASQRLRYATLSGGALLVLLILLSAVLGSGFLFNMLSAFAGILVVCAAAALGLRLLDLPFLALSAGRFASPLERLVLATSLGLGILSLAVFFAGTSGLLNPWLWWSLIVFLLAQGLGLLRSLVRDLASAPAPLHPVALGAVVVIAIWCLSHMPLVWSPPLEYDVLEYHLAAPAQFLRDGRVSFLNENIYAAFPENGEMLYFLGFILGRDKWHGLAAAHTILFASWLLTLAGVYALTSRLAEQDPDAPRSPAPALATALFALTPLASTLAADFYVEHFQALFHLAAVMAACGFLNDRRAGIRNRGAWLALSGALAGLCCGVKYTALIFTLAPLLILVPLFCTIGGSVYEALSSAASLGISALLALAPWLLRNGIMTGDPIFPLGLVVQRRATPPHVLPDHLDHFEVATRAGPRTFEAFLNTLVQYCPGFRKNWLTDSECGPQLLAFTAPGLAGTFRRDTAFIVAFFLLDILLWFFFTYRLNRFLYPLLAPLAVVAGLGIANLWQIQPLRKAVVFVFAAVIAGLGPLTMLFVQMQSRPEYISGAEDGSSAARFHYYQHGNRNWFDGWQGMNALPPNSKVLMIGDAQTFYLDRTPVYSVVFNEGLLERILKSAGDPDDAARLLAAEGITHIYINYSEWFRLDTSYSITRQAPDAPFQYAQMDRLQKELQHELLYGRQFEKYGRAWPGATYPAYLKLNSSGYSTLDQLIHQFTVVEKTFEDIYQRPTCELRRLRLP